jgi:lipocalin
VGYRGIRLVAALAFVGWYLMMPPDSAKIPHEVDADVPLSHWITVASFDTQDSCEKALADIQTKEEDPIVLDKTGKLKRLQKNDPALGKARAVNAGCVESDDFRLKSKK